MRQENKEKTEERKPKETVERKTLLGRNRLDLVFLLNKISHAGRAQ